MTDRTNYDIAVVGGGASGLAAAITAARCGKKTVILEKLPRAGKKILSTGNGRCNLGNSSDISGRLHGSVKNAEDIIRNFGKVEEFFYSLGLLCITDSEGRMYPNSNAASSVLDALRLECDKLGVETICDFEVTDIIPDKKGFTLSGNGKIRAGKVIAATGGCSSPSLGSDGKMLKIAEKLGHEIIKPLPALAPIKTDINAVKALKGLRAFGKASALLDGKEIKTEAGEIQFGDGTLSGICIFNLSELAAKHRERLTIRLDLLPAYSEEQTAEIIRKTAAVRSSYPLEDMLTGIFHKRIGQVLLKKCTDKPLTDKTSRLGAEEIKKLSKTIKSWDFPVHGSAGFEKSQVTAGGVSGKHLDEKLMSTLYNGLYFCGEAVDVNGDCGGYNLMWAWASGCLAGKAAADE